jgi:transposase-like protein
VPLKAEGALEEPCRHRLGRYLNNIVEQEHRAIKYRCILIGWNLIHLKGYC